MSFEKIIAFLSRAAKTSGIRAIQRGTYVGLFSLLAGITIIYLTMPHSEWRISLLKAFQMSLTIMGATISFSVAYFYHLDKGKIASIAVGIISLLSFILTLPFSASLNETLDIMLEVSSSSIFVGLLIAFLCGKLASIYPPLPHLMLIIPLISLLLAVHHIEIHPLVARAVSHIIVVGDSLPAALSVIFLICLLWYSGVHGPAVVGSIVTPIYLVTLSENLSAVHMGLSPPHIVTTVFFNIVFIGGGGSTLSLCFMMLASRVRRLRYISRAAIIPGLANINEFLIFGVPLVMNPFFFIPFFTAPLTCGLITYLATYFHLVSPTYIYCPGFIPSPIAGWLATQGDWRIFLLTIINFFISFLIYHPFFKAYQTRLIEDEGRLDKAGQYRKNREEVKEN